MSNPDPDRITIIAETFSAAALEFHRGQMASRGYLMDGPIVERTFLLAEGTTKARDLFDGQQMFSVSFVKRTSS